MITMPGGFIRNKEVTYHFGRSCWPYLPEFVFVYFNLLPRSVSNTTSAPRILIYKCGCKRCRKFCGRFRRSRKLKQRARKANKGEKTTIHKVPLSQAAAILAETRGKSKLNNAPTKIPATRLHAEAFVIRFPQHANKQTIQPQADFSQWTTTTTTNSRRTAHSLLYRFAFSLASAIEGKSVCGFCLSGFRGVGSA